MATIKRNPSKSETQSPSGIKGSQSHVLPNLKEQQSKPMTTNQPLIAYAYLAAVPLMIGWSLIPGIVKELTVVVFSLKTPAKTSSEHFQHRFLGAQIDMSRSQEISTVA